MIYKKYRLYRSDLNQNPINQFTIWFNEAKKEVLEPEAMALATANLQAVPSCRMVLLKSFDEKGFVFYTNSTSRKGQDLSQNPVAGATFYWKELERQVIIEGSISTVTASEADRYFTSRSRESQIGAWASHQGEELESREVLLKRFNEIKERYKGQEVPRPPYWKGYCLSPQRMEFWQGRESRLHDRFSYKLEQGIWVIKQLNP